MILATETIDSRLETVWTAPTVFEPDQLLAVELSFRTPGGAVSVRGVSWSLPEGIEPAAGSDEVPPFPITADREGVTATFRFRARQETFGEMSAALELAQGETLALAPVWISAFARRLESDPGGLSAEGRRRLVGVVNARDRNSHIFLADYAAFFDDFLNVEVPENLRRLIRRDLALDGQGLPLDQERRLQIIRGHTTFYGIVRARLENSEDCVEDDLRPLATPDQRAVPEEDIGKEG